MEQERPTARLRLRGLVYDWGPCPYLPGRDFQVFRPFGPITGDMYRPMMDSRFRRLGYVFYRPVCPSCRACQPIRVDVAAFRPRKDQRRCLKANADLTVTWHPHGVDDERADLFQRYEAAVHDHAVGDPQDSLVLNDDGGIPGGELHARDRGGRLLAVSVCDRIGDALSSVYCYYEPGEPRRALGKLMVLAEIEHCRSQGLRFLYLGFLVRGCAKMEYKARYFPHEVLEDGGWVRYERPGVSSP